MDIISLAGFLALIIIGIAIILFLYARLMLVPAAVIAAIVFFLACDFWWTGITFLMLLC